MCSMASVNLLPSELPGDREEGQPPRNLLVATYYPAHLAERYLQGELTIKQLADLLEASIYQILYRSQATAQLSNSQLLELLQRARRANAEQQITGLLLYSEGQFVQLLEGPPAAVKNLYARIARDPRHNRVELVREALVPARQFAEWSMDFGFADAVEVEQVLAAIQQQLPAATSVASPQLQALLCSMFP